MWTEGEGTCNGSTLPFITLSVKQYEFLVPATHLYDMLKMKTSTVTFLITLARFLNRFLKNKIFSLVR